MGTNREGITKKVRCPRSEEEVDVHRNGDSVFTTCPEYTGFSSKLEVCALTTKTSTCVVLGGQNGTE